MGGYSFYFKGLVRRKNEETNSFILVLGTAVILLTVALVVEKNYNQQLLEWGMEKRTTSIGWNTGEAIIYQAEMQEKYLIFDETGRMLEVTKEEYERIKK